MYQAGWVTGFIMGLLYSVLILMVASMLIDTIRKRKNSAERPAERHKYCNTILPQNGEKRKENKLGRN